MGNAELNSLIEEAQKEGNFLACKVLDAKSEIQLYAVARFEGGTELGLPQNEADGNFYGSYSLDLVLASVSDGRILARSHQKAAFLSDSLGLKKLRIDEADYTLSRNIKAFGIVAGFQHIGGSNPVTYRTISLYAVKEGRIVKLLSNLKLFEDTKESLGECSGTSSTVERFLSASLVSADTFADLIVKERSVFYEQKSNHGKCVDKQEKYASRYKLKFVQGEYVIPKALRF